MATRDQFSDAIANTEGQASSTGLQHVGRTLRLAREEQGLSLHQLADVLHMGDEQLQALECGDRAHLAESVFVRATVRRVANKLKLDPEPLIAALHDLDQPNVHPANRPAPRPAITKTKEPTPSQRWGGVRFAAAGTAVVAALAAGWSWGGQSLLRLTRQSNPAASRAISDSHPTQKPPSTAAPSTPAAASDASVTIATKEPSWIALRDQQGQLLFEGMLEKEKTIDAKPGLEIYAGRPDLVTVSREGRQLGPLGPIHQVRWYRISAEPSPTDSTL